MAFTDLREFVAHLERHGRLRRITVPVSRDLEITEIVDRVSKTRGAGNVALLFEHVAVFDMPLLVNAFGSEIGGAGARVERLDQLGERIANSHLSLPGSFLDKLKKLGTLLDVAKATPRRVGHAPCQEIVETTSPSLSVLPALTCWPGDGGRYITLPAVFTRDPATGARNVGMYRLQIFDDRTLGMHWQLHKGGAEHQHRATERMPVAIALGGDPALIYAASAPLPPGIDKSSSPLARGVGVEMFAVRTDRLEAAQAEIVPRATCIPLAPTGGPFATTPVLLAGSDYPSVSTAHARADRLSTTIVVPPPQEILARQDDHGSSCRCLS